MRIGVNWDPDPVLISMWIRIRIQGAKLMRIRILVRFYDKHVEILNEKYIYGTGTVVCNRS